MALSSWLKGLVAFDRAKLTLTGACLFLFGGVLMPWYRIPPQLVEGFGINLWPLWIAKFLALFLTLVSAISLAISLWPISLWPDERRSAQLSDEFAPFARGLLWIGLIFFLSFPYALTHLCPELSFVTRDYFNQGIMVSDSAELSILEAQQSWKQNIRLAAPIPIESSVSLNIVDSKFFNMSALGEKTFLNILRYGSSFFIFIAKGWTLCAFGLFAALNATYLRLESKHRLKTLSADLLLVLPGLALALSISIGLSLAANIYSYHLDTVLARGDYTAVVRGSERLGQWYPLLRGDTHFVLREADARHYAKIPDPPLQHLAMGILLYQKNLMPEAVQYLRQALLANPQQYLARGYLANALVQQGVTWFNANNAETATHYFREALWVYPGHLEALYNLMMAEVVKGDFASSALIGTELIDIQSYFHPKVLGRAIVGQAHLHGTWDAFHSGNMSGTWQRYFESLGRE